MYCIISFIAVPCIVYNFPVILNDYHLTDIRLIIRNITVKFC